MNKEQLLNYCRKYIPVGYRVDCYFEPRLHEIVVVVDNMLDDKSKWYECRFIVEDFKDKQYIKKALNASIKAISDSVNSLKEV